MLARPETKPLNENVERVTWNYSKPLALTWQWHVKVAKLTEHTNMAETFPNLYTSMFQQDPRRWDVTWESGAHWIKKLSPLWDSKLYLKGRIVILRASVGGASSRALWVDGLCYYHRFLPPHTRPRCPRGGDELKSYTQRKYLFRSKRQWLAVAFILPHFSRSFGHSLLDCPNKFSQLKARPLASMEMLETILSPCEAFCY